MFGHSKRNGNGIAVAAITTLIAEGTVIRGDVEFVGGLHLDGRIEGAISADGADAVLTLSDKGRVTGEIRTSNAVINGMVQGDIVITERLELASGARIEGSSPAPTRPGPRLERLRRGTIFRHIANPSPEHRCPIPPLRPISTRPRRRSCSPTRPPKRCAS